jgi:hypothetical protein
MASLKMKNFFLLEGEKNLRRFTIEKKVDEDEDVNVLFTSK